MKGRANWGVGKGGSWLTPIRTGRWMPAGFFHCLAQKAKIFGRKAKPYPAQPHLIEIMLVEDYTNIARTRNAKLTGDLRAFLQGLAQ